MTDNEVIGKGYGGFDIIKVATRIYKCRECGHEIKTQTNHRVDCYPTCQGRCRQILNPNTAREVVLRKNTAHMYVADYGDNGL